MSALLHDVLNKQILEADNLSTKLSNLKVDPTSPKAPSAELNPLSPTSKRSSSPNSEDDELIAVVRGPITNTWRENCGVD